MSSGKIYWWLKMQEDLFASRRIKKLRMRENGDTMLIIYFRLQLFSLNTDGHIHFSDPEDPPEVELSIELGEDPEIMKRTLDFLFKNELAERTEGGLFLPWVIENTGSETDSARRMRKARKQLNEVQSSAEIQHCDDPPSQCDNDASQCEKNVTAEQRAESREKRYMHASISLDDVIDFCTLHEIPHDFGKNLFERCSRFEWKDTNGQAINNWQGYFLNAWKSENSKPSVSESEAGKETQNRHEKPRQYYLDECREWPPGSGVYVGPDEYEVLKNGGNLSSTE